jgi:hypothetical protein
MIAAASEGVKLIVMSFLPFEAIIPVSGFKLISADSKENCNDVALLFSIKKDYVVV